MDKNLQKKNSIIWQKTTLFGKKQRISGMISGDNIHPCSWPHLPVVPGVQQPGQGGAVPLLLLPQEPHPAPRTRLYQRLLVQSEVSIALC